MTKCVAPDHVTRMALNVLASLVANLWKTEKRQTDQIIAVYNFISGLWRSKDIIDCYQTVVSPICEEEVSARETEK